jgi:hypothetical protein
VERQGESALKGEGLPLFVLGSGLILIADTRKILVCPRRRSFHPSPRLHPPIAVTLKCLFINLLRLQQQSLGVFGVKTSSRLVERGRSLALATRLALSFSARYSRSASDSRSLELLVMEALEQKPSIAAEPLGVHTCLQRATVPTRYLRSLADPVHAGSTYRAALSIC